MCTLNQPLCSQSAALLVNEMASNSIVNRPARSNRHTIDLSTTQLAIESNGLFCRVALLIDFLKRSWVASHEKDRINVPICTAVPRRSHFCTGLCLVHWRDTLANMLFLKFPMGTTHLFESWQQISAGWLVWLVRRIAGRLTWLRSERRCLYERR